MGLRTIAALACVVLCGVCIAEAGEKEDLTALVEQANRFWGRGQIRQAAEVYERVSSAAARVFGPQDADTATVYNNLAMLYSDLGRYKEAEALYAQALAIREAVFGAEHDEVGACLNNIAILYTRLNRLEQAEAAFRKALKIRTAALGPDHQEIGRLWNNLSIVCKNASRFPESEEAAGRSLKILEQKHGPDAVEVASALTSLANAIAAQGRYAESERLYERALRIRETKLGPDHPDVAQALSNLALNDKRRARFTRAESFLQRSLKIREQVLGPDHVDVAETLTNLAGLLYEFGQPARAEKLYRRILQIREKNLGPDHPEVAKAAHGLAITLQDLDQPEQALKFYLRDLEIRKRAQGPDHVEVADALLALGNFHDQFERPGQPVDTEPFFRRCLEIREAKLGPEHPDTGAALNQLASCLTRKGKWDEAEPLLARSVKIAAASLGPDHPDRVPYGLFNQAKLFAARGDWNQAAETFELTRRIMRRHIARTLPMLNEREQLMFLDNADRPKFEAALALAVQHPNEAGLAAKSAGWLANAKGVAQVALTERTRLARDARDPQLKQAAERLLKVRSELASLANAAPNPAQAAARKARSATLAADERDLANQLASAGTAWDEDPWVTIESIRAALPAETVLIDLARFEHRVFADAKTGTKVKRLGPHYAAWIVPPPGAGEVKLIPLGPAKKIDDAVAAYQAAVKDATTGAALQKQGEADAERQFAKPLLELSHLVLDPLLPQLADAKELVLSPDAGLWLIPWAALPVGDGTLLIEDRRLRMVVASREVAAKPIVGGPVAGPARILADPDYGQGPQAARTALRAVLYPNSTALPAAPTTQLAETDPFRSAAAIGPVGRLPYTAVEASLVAPQLKALTQAEPKVYLGAQAQEGVLKLIRNPRVLLLSTHGYFLPAQAVKSDNEERHSATDDAGSPLENPLLRCGLLLAGCNERDKYNDAELGDGVMTGLEIVDCDFRGTELVVLSACETGLGQVNNGEGVAGLRQAFQLAGAKSVVSTLWQIPDRQSAALMNDFFTNLAAGQTKAEALRNAQLAMIKSRREKIGARHPLFWAAWTVTGD